MMGVMAGCEKGATCIYPLASPCRFVVFPDGTNGPLGKVFRVHRKKWLKLAPDHFLFARARHN
jgi:hypothetical protein